MKENYLTFLNIFILHKPYKSVQLIYLSSIYIQVMTYFNWFHCKSYCSTVFSIFLKIYSPIIVPFRLLIEANSSVTSSSLLTHRINSNNYSVLLMFVNALRAKENHLKFFALSSNCLLMLIPISWTLPTVGLAEKPTDRSKSILSGYISLAASSKYDLINSPSAKWFPFYGQ